MKKFIIVFINGCKFNSCNYSGSNCCTQSQSFGIFWAVPISSAEKLKLDENSTAIAGLGVAGYKIAGSKYSSVGGELQYRYYFKEALHGWYAVCKSGLPLW